MYPGPLAAQRPPAGHSIKETLKGQAHLNRLDRSKTIPAAMSTVAGRNRGRKLGSNCRQLQAMFCIDVSSLTSHYSTFLVSTGLYTLDIEFCSPHSFSEAVTHVLCGLTPPLPNLNTMIFQNTTATSDCGQLFIREFTILLTFSTYIS